MTPIQVLQKQLPHLDKIIYRCCHKKTIIGEHAEDFKSFVYMKLLDNDSKIIREYSGDFKASWSSYLILVISRLAIDYIRKEWGRWESSSKAKSLGKVAIALEILLYRERRLFEDALEILTANSSYSPVHLFTKEVLQESITALSQNKEAVEGEDLWKLASHYAFLKKECKNYLENQFFDNIVTIHTLMQTSKRSMDRELLEGWEMQLQPRALNDKVVVLRESELSKESGEEQNTSFLENFSSSKEEDPLNLLLSDELKKSLKEKLKEVVASLSDLDWLILTLYLENRSVSDLARMFPESSDEAPNLTDAEKKRIFKKNWEHIDKKIRSFQNSLKEALFSLNVAKEEQVEVIHYSISLISNKLLRAN